MYRKFGKRFFDVILSLCALVVLSPVFLVAAVLVRTKLGSPVLFMQERPGLHERIFKLYKFRTMTDAHGEDGQLLPDAARLTKFGKWLRRTSLDELPELWNILKGEMAIVGPRPLLVEYLLLYSEEQRRRHLVRPGLTGLAQVNGRNAISWTEKLAWDVRYVEAVSLGRDIRIIFCTLVKLVRSEGINSQTSATMEAFTGNCERE